MKKLLALILALTAVLPMLFACSSTINPEDVVPDGLQAVDCEGLPYKTYMPISWQAYRREDCVEAVVANGTPVSLSVRHFDCDAQSVTAYWEASVTELTSLYKNFDIVDAPEAYTFGTSEAIAVSYEGRVGESDYRFFQAMLLHEGTLYLLTFCARLNVSTGTDLYATYVESAYLVAKNFKLLDQQSTETETESESTEQAEPSSELAQIGGGDLAGDFYTAYAPAFWEDHSYGSFSFARNPESGSSFSVSMREADVSSYNEFWRGVKTEVLALYPNSRFKLYQLPDADKKVEVGDLVCETFTLDGKSGEQTSYTLVTDKGSYTVYVCAVYHDYRIYTMTYTCAKGSGDAEKALADTLFAAVTLH